MKYQPLPAILDGTRWRADVVTVAEPHVVLCLCPALTETEANENARLIASSVNFELNFR